MANRQVSMNQSGDDSHPVSRRNFLKVTGTIIMVSGTGSLIAADGKKTKKKLPPSDGYILVDTKKCQGCISCMLACSLVHEETESPSLSRIQIMQNSFGAYPHDLDISQCRQCVEPACVRACPEDALTANAGAGNARTVNAAKCVGCGMCYEACPFTPSRSAVAPDKKFKGKDKARKCDLCANAPYHWSKAGGGVNGKQACVEVCPVKAVTFTKEIPEQKGDAGYKVNLRKGSWSGLGYPRD